MRTGVPGGGAPLAPGLLASAAMTARDQHGFTLIELLVVTSIIGILASIAIPQYAAMRARGFDSKVASAVRHVATGEEAFFASNFSYTADVSELDGMVLDDVEITVSPGNSGDFTTSFKINGRHPAASHEFTWVSDPPPGEPNFLTD